MKKESAKYKISPKGKRKLDFPLKQKKTSSVKLPLIGKTVFLDVKELKHQKRLHADLKRLGATLEEFVSKDIDYFITTQHHPRVKKDGRDAGPAPSPFSCDPSPSPGNVEESRVPTVTRGKALAEKARVKSRETNSLLDNAEKWGIKIVSLETAYKWIDKELRKLPKLAHSIDKGYQKPKCIAKYKLLESPFLKLESSNLHYRPFSQHLDVWPRLNVYTPRGSCPFDGTLLRGESKEERGEILGAQVDILSDDTPQEEKDGMDSNTPKPFTEKSTKKSETEGPGSCKILTAGELKRKKELKRRQDRKKGYCECCKIKYDDLDKHVREENHRLYVKEKSNFQPLDLLIGSVQSTAEFLQRCILASVTQRNQLDKNKIRKNKDGNLKSPSKGKAGRHSLRVTTTLAKQATEEAVKQNNPPSANKSIDMKESIPTCSTFGKLERNKHSETKENEMLVPRKSPRKSAQTIDLARLKSANNASKSALQISPVKSTLAQSRSPLKSSRSLKESPMKSKTLQSRSPLKPSRSLKESPMKSKALQSLSPLKLSTSRSLKESPMKSKALQSLSPLKLSTSRSLKESPMKSKALQSLSPLKLSTSRSLKESPMKSKTLQSLSPLKPSRSLKESPMKSKALQSLSPLKLSRSLKELPMKSKEFQSLSPLKSATLDMSPTVSHPALLQKSPFKSPSAVLKSPLKSTHSLQKMPLNAVCNVRQSPRKTTNPFKTSQDSDNRKAHSAPRKLAELSSNEDVKRTINAVESLDSISSSNEKCNSDHDETTESNENIFHTSSEKQAKLESKSVSSGTASHSCEVEIVQKVVESLLSYSKDRTKRSGSSDDFEVSFVRSLGDLNKTMNSNDKIDSEIFVGQESDNGGATTSSEIQFKEREKENLSDNEDDSESEIQEKENVSDKVDESVGDQGEDTTLKDSTTDKASSRKSPRKKSSRRKCKEDTERHAQRGEVKETDDSSNTVDAGVSGSHNGFNSDIPSDFQCYDPEGERLMFSKSLADRVKERGKRSGSVDSYNLNTISQNMRTRSDSFSSTVSGGANKTERRVAAKKRLSPKQGSTKSRTSASVASQKICSKYRNKRNANHERQLPPSGYQGDDERDAKQGKIQMIAPSRRAPRKMFWYYEVESEGSSTTCDEGKLKSLPKEVQSLQNAWNDVTDSSDNNNSRKLRRSVVTSVSKNKVEYINKNVSTVTSKRTQSVRIENNEMGRQGSSRKLQRKQVDSENVSRERFSKRKVHTNSNSDALDINIKTRKQTVNKAKTSGDKLDASLRNNARISYKAYFQQDSTLDSEQSSDTERMSVRNTSSLVDTDHKKDDESESDESDKEVEGKESDKSDKEVEENESDKYDKEVEDYESHETDDEVSFNDKSYQKSKTRQKNIYWDYVIEDENNSEEENDKNIPKKLQHLKSFWNNLTDVKNMDLGRRSRSGFVSPSIDEISDNDYMKEMCEQFNKKSSKPVSNVTKNGKTAEVEKRKEEYEIVTKKNKSSSKKGDRFWEYVTETESEDDEEWVDKTIHKKLRILEGTCNNSAVKNMDSRLRSRLSPNTARDGEEKRSASRDRTQVKQKVDKDTLNVTKQTKCVERNDHKGTEGCIEDRLDKVKRQVSSKVKKGGVNVKSNEPLKSTASHLESQLIVQEKTRKRACRSKFFKYVIETESEEDEEQMGESVPKELRTLKNTRNRLLDLKKKSRHRPASTARDSRNRMVQDLTNENEHTFINTERSNIDYEKTKENKGLELTCVDKTKRKNNQEKKLRSKNRKVFWDYVPISSQDENKHVNHEPRKDLHREVRALQDSLTNLSDLTGAENSPREVRKKFLNNYEKLKTKSDTSVVKTTRKMDEQTENWIAAKQFEKQAKPKKSKDICEIVPFDSPEKMETNNQKMETIKCSSEIDSVSAGKVGKSTLRKKKKTYWDYKPITSPDKDKVVVDKTLCKELHILKDSWNDLSPLYTTQNLDSLPRRRINNAKTFPNQVKITEKVVKRVNSLHVGKDKISAGEKSVDNQTENNESERKSMQLIEQNNCEKSPVKSTLIYSNDDVMIVDIESSSPVFKKSPVSKNITPTCEQSELERKRVNISSNLQEIIGTLTDKRVDPVYSQNKYTTPEKAKELLISTPQSGYSTSPRERRRKQWKRKIGEANSGNGSSTNVQPSKRRKLEKLKFRIEEKTDYSQIKGLISPRKSILSPHKKSTQSPKKLTFVLSDLNKQSVQENMVECKLNHNKVATTECSNINSVSLKWQPVTLNSSTCEETKKVKLNKSWTLISDKSASRLLSSEDDRESFNGFNDEDVEKNNSLPSDMSFEEHSEVDINSSEHEWTVEDAPSDNDQEFSKFVPTFSSPGKQSEPDWELNIDCFMKTKVSDKNQSCLSVTSPWRSPRRSAQKHETSVTEKITPVKQKGKSFLHRINEATDSEKADREIVDEDIEFNHKSPQKFRCDFSPLRAEKGVIFGQVRKNVTSTPSENGKSKRKLDTSYSGLVFSYNDDNTNSDLASNIQSPSQEYRILKKKSDVKKSFSLKYDASPPGKPKKHKFKT